MLNTTIRRTLTGFCIILTVSVLVALTAAAQTTTSTREVTGTKTVTSKISGTIIYNEGGTIVARMSNGQLRTFTPPADRMVTVDGQDIPARELKVGTLVHGTTLTTTKSVLERTVTINSGKVWFVSGNTVIVTMSDGKNKMFKVTKDYKFIVDGKPTDVSSLRKGMTVNGEKVVEEPLTEVASNTAFTGTAPKPKPVVAAAPAPARAAAPPAAPETAAAEPAPAEPGEPAPAKLPKTGSPLPLAGLLGMLFTGAGLGLRKLRNRR